MKANEYQQKALRTASGLSREELILNGILGLAGESGEVADIIKKYYFQGHELARGKIIEELGDVCWYVAVLSKGLDVDLETVMQKNVDKLLKRYPNGFEKEKSIERKE